MADDRRERERIEEQEALDALPIYFTGDGQSVERWLLPERYQHLAPAIARLEGKGIVTRVSNGRGPRWVRTRPWEA